MPDQASGESTLIDKSVSEEWLQNVQPEMSKAYADKTRLFLKDKEENYSFSYRKHDWCLKENTSSN